MICYAYHRFALICITSFLLCIPVLTLRYSLRSHLKSKPSFNIPWYIWAIPLMSSLRSLIKSHPFLSIHWYIGASFNVFATLIH